MLHLGAVIPNLANAADAHYNHLTEETIKGGLLRYEHGKIRVPDRPELGVKLDREKLGIYAADLYLASDEAAVMTGTAPEIDGGWSAGK